jgi:hypothetical protein
VLTPTYAGNCGGGVCSTRLSALGRRPRGSWRGGRALRAALSASAGRLSRAVCGQFGLSGWSLGATVGRPEIIGAMCWP